MKKVGVLTAASLALLAALAIGSYAVAGDGKDNVQADAMTGYL
jgi:hypothetical protein